ncbi:MAG: tetratricopeptide repeat protein [Polyangiaceae bacterium]|nr:tetratricopeptide repeat protein [Polyangiaceae bacterium]MCW5789581.1 tetratricopeptide repeat protein [Polyangiaceae bacterium]
MSALTRAMAALQQGNPLAGERIITSAVDVAVRTYGVSSAQAAAAHFEASQFFHAAGQAERVIEALRAATEIAPEDAAGWGARANYLFHLGAALDRERRLDEAEAVLRALSLELSQAFGPLHVSTATAQTALGGVLFEQGEIDEALEVVNEAVATLQVQGDPGLASALALRAFVIKAVSPVEPALPEELELSESTMTTLIEAALERVPQAAPPLALLTLTDLASCAAEALGADHAARRALLAQCVRTAAEAGDAEAQEAALRTLDALAAKAGQLLAQSDVALALAELLTLQGDDARGEAEYQRAARLAEKDPKAFAVALARHGQHLAARGDEPARAAELMERATEAARDSKDRELIGSCLTAHGVVLHHQGAHGEAELKLTAALDLLPLGHPEADVASAHLDALEAGTACTCFGDPALIERATKALQRELPAGLVERVALGQGGLQLQLSRAPSEAEQAQISSVLSEVMADK